MSSLLPAKAGIVPHWSSPEAASPLVSEREGRPHELVLHSPHQILSGALWSSSVPAPEGSVLMARVVLPLSEQEPSRCYYHQAGNLNPYHAHPALQSLARAWAEAKPPF